ncbi:hypothetical protein J5N97_011399 [Dioscorea zingiberensis]|uniref:Uncharacterized protein n=1 Tax=Dioscorea zingiberensis TaxID=325984 RepID=A0A9D5D1Y2_9LILI|nr:hypothetical protein J5N97_011399 [Dioscorea zingiberensis]
MKSKSPGFQHEPLALKNPGSCEALRGKLKKGSTTFHLLELLLLAPPLIADHGLEQHQKLIQLLLIASAQCLQRVNYALDGGQASGLGLVPYLAVQALSLPIQAQPRHQLQPWILAVHPSSRLPQVPSKTTKCFTWKSTASNAIDPSPGYSNADPAAFRGISVVGVGIERADEEARVEVDVGDGDDGEVSEAELGDADGVEGVTLLEVVLENGDGDGVVDRRGGEARAQAGAQGFGAVVA